MCISDTPGIPLYGPKEFENNPDGFKKLISWFKYHGIKRNNMIICMEATGVYSEQLCYCLFKSKYRVAVEPPLRVKRAFKPQGHKTDPVDSIQIAEYALRLYDALNIWQPREEIVEKMKSLITARELLVTQRTATTNSITALKRKSVTPTKAIQILERQRKSLGRNIKALEDEMDHLLNP